MPSSSFIQPWVPAWARACRDESLKSLLSNKANGDSGLTGLSEMFSLNAVDRPTFLLPCPSFTGKSGSVSDRFILFLINDSFGSIGAGRMLLCFLLEIGGVGMRHGAFVLDGRRACDLLPTIPWFRHGRVGSGRLLNVRLLGIPPMGSSCRHTYRPWRGAALYTRTGTGGGGTSVCSSWTGESGEDETIPSPDLWFCGALTAVLDKERLLADESAVLLSVVLLERRREKGLIRACSDARELRRRTESRRESL